MSLGRLEDVQERYQIVPVIHDRLRNRLTHSLEGSEMDDCINLIISKKLLHQSGVTAVDLLERNVIPSGNLLDSLETCHVAIGQVISHNDIKTSLDQLDRNMTADISGATRNKDSLCHNHLFFTNQTKLNINHEPFA